MTSRRYPLIAPPQSWAWYQPSPSIQTHEPYGMSFGSTATMRAFGFGFHIVEVNPSLSLPYASLRAVYCVTVKRWPHERLPIDGAFCVAASMLSWLRESAVSATSLRRALRR